MSAARFEIVIPTVGRPSLAVLLDRLGAVAPGARVWVVDDRPGPASGALSAHAADGLGGDGFASKEASAEGVLSARAADRLGGGRSASKEDGAEVALSAHAADRLGDGRSASRAGETGPGRGSLAVTVLRSGGRGPAAARNLGWRAGSAPWVVFLDDDVLPGERWAELLLADLAAADAAASPAPPRITAGLGVSQAPRPAVIAVAGAGVGESQGVGGVQGRIRVPLPGDRRATDWERNVAGLERARWATADLAFRREALERVGGFDERFRRNYREDADLGLRVVAAGWSIVTGERETVHPVGPTRWNASIARQRGNADDALMRRLHGPAWRTAAGAPPGRLPRHAATAAAGIAAAALASLPSPRAAAALAATAWAAGTAELAWARIAPGPRTPGEVAAMVATSAALPFAAVWHRLAGEWRWRSAAPTAPPRSADGEWHFVPAMRGESATHPARGTRDVGGLPAAVLFDRDGTLVEDVPYNGDPLQVVLQPGALDALAALRAAGIPTAVVSNQSGIARGLLTAEQVEAVNDRVDELLGGVGPWLVCPHGPADGCDCRKPAPGLVLAAAAELGVAPERCVVIGDIGADVAAARAAGARAVLVPTPATLPAEVDDADEVAPDILTAVRRVLTEEVVA